MTTLLKKRRNLLILTFVAAASFVMFTLIAVFFKSWLENHQYNSFYSEGESYYSAGDHINAIRCFERALDIDKRPEAYMKICDIYLELENTDKAIETLYKGSYSLNDKKIVKRLGELKQQQAEDAKKLRLSREINIGGLIYQKGSTQLSLRGRELSDITPLAEMELLEVLDLSQNEIVNISPLTGMSKLTMLNLKGNSVSDIAPLVHLGSLKALYLDGNPIDDTSPLKSLTRLETLSLMGVDITGKQRDELKAALPKCNILYDTITDFPHSITLGGITFSSTVTELSLAGLSITDISSLAGCTNLRRLNLANNQISDISALAKLQGLQWLALWGNDITDISALESLTQLVSLDLRFNSISSLEPLKNLTGLQEIHLDSNSVPFDSLKPLAALTFLRTLGLSETLIDDSDLAELEGIKTMTLLRISGCSSISPQQVDQLKITLPNCKVSS